MSRLELALRERLRRDYSAEGMEELFVRLDLLHDYAAAGQLDEVTTLSRNDLQGWLEELIFTAREILHEMRNTAPDGQVG
jgi:soluble cytochrome b562